MNDSKPVFMKLDIDCEMPKEVSISEIASRPFEQLVHRPPQLESVTLFESVI